MWEGTADMILLLGLRPTAINPVHSTTSVLLPLRRRSHTIRACAENQEADDQELRRRLAALADAEALQQERDRSQLLARMADVSSGETKERELYAAGFGSLPVVCFDAMVPLQQLKIDTDDPTFCRLLRDVGLSGLFVMTSLNFAQKRVRRSGVVVRVALVDAPRDREETPTAVSALLVGRRRVRVIGEPEQLR